jgi:hypothetical protein
LFLLAGSGVCQDPRGTISGRVTDQQGARVAGAAVVATNIETNVVNRTSTNESGVFDIVLLNPGKYTVTVELDGFKKAVQSGIELSIAGQLNLEIRLEVGQVAESIQVTAEAPLLNTVSASGGRVIDNREVTELPFTNMNPFALAGLAAGMQWTGGPEALRPFDNAGTSSFNTMGGVGNNEYSIDGAPATGTGRRVAFIPPADSVGEFKLETTPFDASYGGTSGAVINVMTKAGTNLLHGSLFDQHWQQRWNATPHFTRLAYEDAVRRGEKKASDPKQESGRQNNFGGSIGGPVRIPGLYSGKDRFFFFVSYNGIYQRKSETGTDIIYNTVPKLAWRTGDFSDLLAVDAVRYTVYDPRSAARQGSRVVRTPFPGNKGVPVLNPVYSFYAKLYPAPNDVPGITTSEGYRNYFAPAVLNDSKFNSMVNRNDYHHSEAHRTFGRWYWNKRTADTRDWLYSTAKGVGTVDLNRINYGVGVSHTWIVSTRNILDVGVSWMRFNEGNLTPGMNRFSPGEVGLPAYLDAKAGNLTTLPTVEFGNINDIGRVYGQIQRRGSTGELKAAMTSIAGNHTVKYGWSERRYWYTGSDNGYTSGRFTFDHQYTRAADNTTTAANFNLAWASFMMGVPSAISIDTNDTAYLSSHFRALYVQDDWKVSSRLRLSPGLRYERESGIRERFNRGLAGGFVYDARLPFSEQAEATYAKAPLAELPAAQFQSRGGVQYLGAASRDFTDGTHHLLPRIGAVYQLTPKTVLRGGYGSYYDTLNANNTQPNQYGFSQPTSTPVTSDLGLSFCCGVGSAANLTATRNPMSDPFPVRADGTRFDDPTRDALGSAAYAGRSLTYTPREYNTSWQQRWRVGVQRQLARNMVVEVSYNGAYARIPASQRLDYLPQQYWATGMKRQSAIDNDLNANVANPYYYANLKGLDPVLSQYLSTQSYFTSPTIRKNRLLRPFSEYNGLYGLRPGVDFNNARGSVEYRDLQVQLERRMTRGFQTAVMYTWAHSDTSDFYANEFDEQPSSRPSTMVRPHRFVWTAIWQLPVRRGGGVARRVAAGWQLSWIYQFQNGGPTSWSNYFYYGDINQIASVFQHDDAHAKDVHMWFNPNIRYTGAGDAPQGFAGFEGRSGSQPGAFHVRVFPTRLDALRTDGIRNWDVKLLRRFQITERLRSAFSVDLLNATNHTNFGAPNTNPTNTDFGRVTSQVGLSRFIQLNLRFDF